MKKIATIILMCAMFVGVTLINNTYTMRYCKVTDVNGSLITITDNKGDQWLYCITDDQKVEIYDECKLTMWMGMNPYDSRDDKILKIKWHN
jgi:hypothetical protein